MARLTLSVAVGDYDRTRPLIDGTVRIDGIETVVMTLTPEDDGWSSSHRALSACDLVAARAGQRVSRGRVRNEKASRCDPATAPTN